MPLLIKLDSKASITVRNVSYEQTHHITTSCILFLSLLLFISLEPQQPIDLLLRSLSEAEQS